MDSKHTPLNTRSRIKTQDRGGRIQPENTVGRVKTSGRGIVEPEGRAPQGVSATIKAENVSGRSTTKDFERPVNAAARMNPVKPKATRETPRAALRGNPLK